MKQITYVYFLALGFLLLTSCGTTKEIPESAELSKSYPVLEMKMTYKDLKILDLDQMTDLLYEKVSQYKKTDQLETLKEGLMLAYSRPNEDGILDKIQSIVRSPLEDMTEYNAAIEGLVSQSLEMLRNEKNTASEQVTAGIILENILADFRPAYIKQYETGGFETVIIESIARANVSYSKAALAEKKLNLMKSGASPSRIAERLVEIKKQTLEKEKK